LPGVEIPSAGISLPGDWAAALRSSEPPVIARVVGAHTVCDLRAVDPADDAALAKALAACASPA
jgi:L-seryl-tRNA(Ser) seleniumtransferase